MCTDKKLEWWDLAVWFLLLSIRTHMKSTIEKFESSAMSRKAEKDVRVFRNVSSIVQTCDTQRARNLVQRKEQQLVG